MSSLFYVTVLFYICFIVSFKLSVMYCILMVFV